MSRIISIIFVVMFFVSCKNGKTSAPIGNGHDSLAINWEKASVKPGDKMYFGHWEAHIEYDVAKTQGRPVLVVSGAVDLENPDATVILMKPPAKKQSIKDCLILNLSKRPRKTLRRPAKVNYTEKLQLSNQYKAISIMYREDSVAIITNIADVK